ncbi:MAG: leucyl aminopeptidase family protein [Alphaproteobacteria bacterium]
MASRPPSSSRRRPRTIVNDPPGFAPVRGGGRTIGLRLVSPAGLARYRKKAGARERRWIEATGFKAETHRFLAVPAVDGLVSHVLVGFDSADPEAVLYGLSHLPGALAPGRYRIEPDHSDPAPDLAMLEQLCLGWALGAYRFERFKSTPSGEQGARLAWPDGVDSAHVARLARAVGRTRDLVNLPASDLGPAELAAAARDLAREFGARCHVISGAALLKKNYPAIYAVGQGSDRPPCLIDLVWGRPRDPKVTLVGKGVTFDTGGLNLKPDQAMKLMKKDMGGAAHVLGLAGALMEAGTPIRLRVLIPAVENSPSGRAMRPLDVVPTRKGTTIEIGHTDAEGRVILADALFEASREKPALLLDWATLTGAARVALGTDIAALFANQDDLALDLMAAGERLADPLWRLPLHQGYRTQIDSKVGDISNTGSTPYAGAITAALFLAHFVGPGVPWAHMDVMAYNISSRPGRPEGGEALGLRAAYHLIRARFAAG